MAASSSRLGVLASREFRLLFLAQAATSLGNGISAIALAFAVLGDHDSAVALSTVFAVGAVPQVVLLVLGGAIADRVPARQRVMLASDGARALLQVAIGSAVLLGPVPLWAFAAQAFLWNAAEAFFRPALSGLVPQTVPRDRLQEANGLLATTPSLGLIVGAAVGGALVAVTSPGWALLVDAATFASSALLLSAMRVRRAVPDAGGEGARGLLADVREGWAEVRTRRWLLFGAIAEGFYSLIVVPAIVVLGPILAKRELGGAGAWGAIDACFGLGLLLGGLVLLRWRPRRLLVAGYLSLVLFLPHFALLAEVGPVWLIAVATVPAGACASVWQALWETTMQQEVPPERLSRASSLATLGFYALFPVGFALVGPLSELIGLRGAFWLANACVLGNIVAVLALPEARAIVRRPAVALSATGDR